MTPTPGQNTVLVEQDAQPSILVVDDVAENCDIVRHRLEMRGYTVTCATSGAQALQLLAEQPVSVILLDVMMPGMSGHAVLEAIQARFGDAAPPVIMLTARDEPDEMSRAIELGAADYVTKPFDFQVLEARIRSQLRRARSTGELRLRTSELEAHLQSLSDRQRVDPLTGLRNLRTFEGEVSRALAHARANATTHVLCVFALEELQAINHTYGPAAGDTVLRSMARFLVDGIDAGDTLARLRGDKFALLLRNTTLTAAHNAAERILQRLTHHTVDTGDDQLTVSVSIGLTPVDGRHASVLALIHGAEHACRLARLEGSNHIRVYRGADAQLEDVRANMRWAMKLKHALRDDALLLYAQPIVASGQRQQPPKRLEILVRMLDEGEIVSPGLFLPAIEKHGLATELDRWVLDNTLNYLADLPAPVRAGMERISINLSGHSLGSRKFRDFAIARMRDSAADPAMICFEITETAAVVHLEHAADFILGLRDLGACFALDDFGAGVSSFGYLRSLPVDCLKIDGQFVRSIDTSRLDRGIVTAIHQIAQVMGMETVAEFVENEAMVEALDQIGIDYLQGYHLGRPQPLSDYLSADTAANAAVRTDNAAPRQAR